jgi:two-component system, cell cycle sensor histidine kinase and response regulator CckA
MALRFKPFGLTISDRPAAACALGVTVAVFILLGQAQLALALLAAVGAAGGILVASGHLRLSAPGGAPGPEFYEIADALPGAIAVTDRKGCIVFRTPGFAEAAGMGHDHDLSRLGERHPGSAAVLFRLFAAARGGKSHEEPITLPVRNTLKTFLLRASSISEVRAPRFIVWQISQAKDSSETDAARQDQLESLPLPAMFVSKNLTVESANRNLETLTGCSAKGMEAWTLFRTRRGKPPARAWLREILARPSEPAQVQLSNGDGFQPVSLLSSTDSRGNTLCVLIPGGVLANPEASFEFLHSRSPLPMALIDTKGVVEAANERFKELFLPEASTQSPRPPLIGKSLALLVAAASAQNLRERLTNLAGAGQPNSIEVHADLKELAGRRVRLTIFPAALQGYCLVQATGMETAALPEEEAAQSQKLQAVGELAGGIAHDFNNLLTAIIGYSDLLMRRFRASDPAFKDVMNIKNSAARAAELVAQILAYSRRQTLRPALIQITDAVEQFRATMGRTLGEKIKIRVDHGRDLWLLKADESQLWQVIMNLAVNARDAMPGGGEIRIRTANVSERESLALSDRGLERGEYVLCEVSDAGTGIRPEHLQKIFDPFFSTKEVGKGTGLGLSTVYGIVKQTGGTILVDSEIGKGTTFRIYLPRYAGTDDDLKALEIKPATLPANGADLTGSGTVLLVEDEETVRSFASRALSTRGYKVIEAASGVEALEIMDREKGEIDLVLSDVVMPEMDGPTLMRHLRQRKPGIRIVFMSGYAEEAFRKNLAEDEEFTFLPKPFTLKKLAETVKAAAA